VTGVVTAWKLGLPTHLCLSCSFETSALRPSSTMGSTFRILLRRRWQAPIPPHKLELSSYKRCLATSAPLGHQNSSFPTHTAASSSAECAWCAHVLSDWGFRQRILGRPCERSVGLAGSQGIALLDNQLRLEVTSRHDELLDQAVQLREADNALAGVNLSVGSLQSALRRVRMEIMDPYNQVENWKHAHELSPHPFARVTSARGSPSRPHS
jgi:Golgi transport complex subunit 5